MARINFETKIFTDERFLRLAIKLGDSDRAIGALVRMWSLAQTWYLKADDRRIPIEEWQKQGLPMVLIEVGLAHSNGQTIRAAGADEAFRWLLDKQEAGRAGGRKSAETRRAKYGTAQPHPTEQKTEPPKQCFEKPEAVLRDSPKHPEASLLFSLSSSLSSPNSELITPNSEERGKGQLALPSVGVPDLMAIWNQNCGALPKCAAMNKSRAAKWKARWRERPDEHYWEATVQRLADSPFANGSNDRAWRASIDFLLQSDAHLKINEGKYDDRKRGPLNAGLAQMVREGKI